MKSAILVMVVSLTSFAHASGVDQLNSYFTKVAVTASEAALAEPAIAANVVELQKAGFELTQKIATPVQLAFGDEGFDGMFLVTMLFAKINGPGNVEIRTILAAVKMSPMLTPKVKIVSDIQLK